MIITSLNEEYNWTNTALTQKSNVRMFVYSLNF